MAPTRSKKRKSTESISSMDIHNFPASPQISSTKLGSSSRTPIHKSPAKNATMGITLNQKQALIDNLQLEITERARKLRAQYMLQAQGLRTRIEIRVNRIPMAMRKANMGQLAMKYSEKQPKANADVMSATPTKIYSPSKNLLQASQSNSRASPSPQRGTKRISDGSNDQENEDVENPKKRARGARPQLERATSRPKVNPSQVLSPRSANSQTLSRSPIRPAVTSGRSYLARPVSPLKTTTTAPAPAAAVLNTMVERAKSTRATAGRKAPEPASTVTVGTGRGRRTAGTTAAAPAPAPKIGRGRASTTSDSSDASSNTTVVRKPVAAAKKAPVKKTMMSTLKGMGGGASKRLPAAKPASGTATATRVLRKRT